MKDERDNLISGVISKGKDVDVFLIFENSNYFICIKDSDSLKDSFDIKFPIYENDLLYKGLVSYHKGKQSNQDNTKQDLNYEELASQERVSFVEEKKSHTFIWTWLEILDVIDPF